MSWKDILGGYGPKIFGNLQKDPTRRSQETIAQIPGQTKPYFEPYYNAGVGALNQNKDEYGNLIKNPGARLNQIGLDYQESPGLQASIRNSERAAGHAAAAGGMLGSNQHQYNAMKDANDLSNQDYYNWLNRATGLYGQGLHGNQELISGGQSAGEQIAKMIASSLGDKAGLQYSSADAKNKQISALVEMFMKAIGSGGGFI